MGDAVDPWMVVHQCQHGVGLGEIQPVEAEGTRPRTLADPVEPCRLERRVVIGVEVVEADHVLAARHQGAAEMRADEAGAAGHQDLAHAGSSAGGCVRAHLYPQWPGMATRGTGGRNGRHRSATPTIKKHTIGDIQLISAGSHHYRLQTRFREDGAAVGPPSPEGATDVAARIVLLDRHHDSNAGLAAFLTRHGLVADSWPAAEPSLERLAAAPPALVVLNRRLRVDPGLDMLRQLRAMSPVPTILRAMDADDEVDRVLALELGADDYVPSGTSPREVLARIRTVLRRAGPPGATAREPGWRLCPKQRDLFAPDRSARLLTSAEFELMHMLARQQGVPVQRDALSLAVLRRPYHPEDRALDNLVLRLRRKLGDEAAPPRLIKSVRGVGYVFVGFDEARPDAFQPCRRRSSPPRSRNRVVNSSATYACAVITNYNP
jgi:two-component system OmpR family response regulator